MQKIQNLYNEQAQLAPVPTSYGIPLNAFNSALNIIPKADNPFNISLSNSGLVINSKEFNEQNKAKKQLIASKLNSTQPIKNLFDATAALVAKDNNGNNLLDTSRYSH